MHYFLKHVSLTWNRQNWLIYSEVWYLLHFKWMKIYLIEYYRLSCCRSLWPGYRLSHYRNCNIHWYRLCRHWDGYRSANRLSYSRTWPRHLLCWQTPSNWSLQCLWSCWSIHCSSQWLKCHRAGGRSGHSLKHRWGRHGSGVGGGRLVMLTLRLECSDWTCCKGFQSELDVILQSNVS